MEESNRGEIHASSKYRKKQSLLGYIVPAPFTSSSSIILSQPHFAGTVYPSSAPSTLLYQHIQTTNATQPQNHTTPKTDIIQRLLPFHPPRALQHHNRQLQHLRHEAIPTDLFGDASQNDLVTDGADEKGDERGDGSTQVWSGGAVDVPPEEVVYGDVPFTREFKPVGGVPPVGVEVAVGEAWAEY